MIPVIEDQALPHLARALDPDCARDALARVLGRKIERLDVVHTRYKPGRNCLISYQAGSPEDLITGRVYGPGESHSRYEKAPGAMHVRELEMVVWPFPRDRKLTGLPWLRDKQWLRAEAGRITGRDYDGVDPRIIHYVPEHGCTVYLPGVFLKTYPRDEGSVTFRNMRALWKNNRVTMAEPLHYDAARRMLWQTALHGAPANAIPPKADIFESAGAALAALHTSSLDSGELVDGASAVSRLLAAASLLKQAGTSADAVVEQLIADAPAQTDTATLHGDLHLKNIFVTADGVAFIDLDSLHNGDPLQDLGSFLASICCGTLTRCGDHESAAPVIGAILRGYRDQVPWIVDARSLAWHTRAALVYEQAQRCVTRLKLQRRAILNALLGIAASLRSEWL